MDIMSQDEIDKIQSDAMKIANGERVRPEGVEFFDWLREDDKSLSPEQRRASKKMDGMFKKMMNSEKYDDTNKKLDEMKIKLTDCIDKSIKLFSASDEDNDRDHYQEDVKSIIEKYYPDDIEKFSVKFVYEQISLSGDINDLETYVYTTVNYNDTILFMFESSIWNEGSQTYLKDMKGELI